MKLLLQYAFVAALAIVSTLAFPQPQAPIEWGNVRLLQILPDTMRAQCAWAFGDTIVLTGVAGSDPNIFTTVRVSPDNGNIWSPWHQFVVGIPTNSWGATAVANLQGIFLCTDAAQGRGLYQTTDLGFTWISPTVSMRGLRALDAMGDTIICESWPNSVHGVTWTNDSGHSFAPMVDIDIGASWNFFWGITASPQYMHWIAQGPLGEDTQMRHHVGRVSFTGSPPPAEHILNPQFFGGYACDVESDRQGLVVVATVAMYTPPVLDWGALIVNSSWDDGLTWSAADTMTAGETVDPFAVQVKHCGSLWAVVYGDSMHQAPFVGWGTWIRLSANRARSWYPAQQIHDTTGIGTSPLNDITVSLSRIRVYQSTQTWQGMYGEYFLQWEGRIRVDSLQPVILSADSLPAEIGGDALADFAAVSQDNDSLWQMQVVLRRLGHLDSLVLSLLRMENNNFAASWRVPGDTTEWLYYYRAEDMWENVSFMPPEGPAAPWRFHVGQLASQDNFTLSPSSFIFSVFPNPFNSTAIFSFTLPEPSPVTLRIFNLLGQDVYAADLGQLSSGEHRHIFHARDLPSGLYFARVEAASMVKTRKVMLLR